MTSESSRYRELRILQGRPVKDNRRRRKDYHQDGYVPPGGRKSGKQLSKWDRRYIVAWDGEGANLPDGSHVYNLLANSQGLRILNHEGLGTKEIFDFFCKYGDPRAINVIFGGSYDINMILRDMPWPKVKTLWRDGTVFWDNYRLYYAPRKKFTVQKFVRKGDGSYRKITFVLWDVLGYFQTSFVTACRKWLGDHPLLESIQSMKEERSVFSVDRIDEIIKYNSQECELLVLLMTALFDSFDYAGIQPRRFDGSGSIAAAMLRDQKVKQHKGILPDYVRFNSQIAYSGGRIEAVKVGNQVDINVYRKDINSAYPFAMVDLPSFQGATYEHSFVWDGNPWSMVDVEWHIKDEQPFYPLWYREHDGTILYPRWGRGVYYGYEISNLIDFFVEGRDYEIMQAINITINNPLKPFDFVPAMYDVRLRFKQAGNMAHESLKLGLNSLYGKLAQQAGGTVGHPPTYHQLLWAGMITAKTRANLYHVAMQNQESIIAFATDAIISTDELDVKVGTGLGEWTADEFTGITIVQPGVYFLRDQEGSWGEKYRGFDKGSLMRRDIIDAWRNRQPFYKAHLTRFVTMGAAVNLTEDHLGKWRTWVTDERRLSLMPSGKRSPGPDNLYFDHLCDTIATTNMSISGEMSTPYPIIWEDGGSFKQQIDGVDMREIDNEYLDSFE